LSSVAPVSVASVTVAPASATPVAPASATPVAPAPVASFPNRHSKRHPCLKVVILLSTITSTQSAVLLTLTRTNFTTDFSRQVSIKNQTLNE
jgi:hypothetical protein